MNCICLHTIKLVSHLSKTIKHVLHLCIHNNTQITFVYAQETLRMILQKILIKVWIIPQPAHLATQNIGRAIYIQKLICLSNLK
jgi:hypothetical protein